MVKQIGAFFLKYIVVGILMTILIIGLFHSPIWAGMILFYRGIVFIAIATVVSIAAIYYALKIPFVAKHIAATAFPLEAIFSTTIAVAALHLCFFTLAPVTFDRSVSTFMLSRMSSGNASQEQQFTKDQIHTILVSEYVDKYDAVGRRLNEQIQSKNIMQVDGKYQLTPQGEHFLQISKVITSLYAISDRYVAKQ